MPLAALMDEMEGKVPTADMLHEVAEALRKECEIMKPGDRVLDFSVAHGRMYCTVLSETQTATHNSGCLRLIVAGIDSDDSVVWETVIRLPLSAPDSQGLFLLAGDAADSGITHVVEWLTRFHGLTQKQHEHAMLALFKTTDPYTK